ncbi:hypothetical protein HD596_000394 [Nonomuraea jabiensis]|uniref:Uncharacterized protein n=1 Tax=Nonomuraea jabiensis TaxID=882448 RepID=A0A7W9L7M2_9ACTN|nr:hypothetical protein [Nonomuraea jabiensis]
MTPKSALIYAEDMEGRLGRRQRAYPHPYGWYGYVPS